MVDKVNHLGNNEESCHDNSQLVITRTRKGSQVIYRVLRLASHRRSPAVTLCAGPMP